MECFPLTESLIEQTLNNLDVPYNHKDGKFNVRFPPDKTHGLCDILSLGIEGELNEVLAIQVMTNKYFPESQTQKLLLMTNEHNARQRWPRAFLVLPKDKSEQLDVQFDIYVDCEFGVSASHIENWIKSAVSGADRFLNKVVVDERIQPEAAH